MIVAAGVAVVMSYFKLVLLGAEREVPWSGINEKTERRPKGQYCNTQRNLVA